MRYATILRVGPVGFRLGSDWRAPIAAVEALYRDYPKPDFADYTVRLEAEHVWRRWIRPSVRIAGDYRLPEAAPEPLPMGKAALRRAGKDLALISYGAYVHAALRVADTLAAEDGVEAAVLDLRCLSPLDREAVIALARHCGKVLIAHEDSRTGGIGESLAAVIQEECFEELDAPVRVVGALDTPVPYAPTLEDAFLPGEAGVLRAARLLAAY